MSPCCKQHRKTPMGTTKTTPTPPPYPHKNAENPWAKYQTSGCCLITSITVPLQPLPAHNHAGLRFVNHHHPTSKPYWLRINRKHPDPRRQHQLTTTSESTTKTNHDKTLLNRQRLRKHQQRKRNPTTAPKSIRNTSTTPESSETPSPERTLSHHDHHHTKQRKQKLHQNLSTSNHHRPPKTQAKRRNRAHIATTFHKDLKIRATQKRVREVMRSESS
jgi:hypothetical protein